MPEWGRAAVEGSGQWSFRCLPPFEQHRDNAFADQNTVRHIVEERMLCRCPSVCELQASRCVEQRAQDPAGSLIELAAGSVERLGIDLSMVMPHNIPRAIPISNPSSIRWC